MFLDFHETGCDSWNDKPETFRLSLDSYKRARLSLGLSFQSRRVELSARFVGNGRRLL
jgi:hypothetical protein